MIQIMLEADLVPVAEELGGMRRSSWNFRQHRRSAGERFVLFSIVVVIHIRWRMRQPFYCVVGL